MNEKQLFLTKTGIRLVIICFGLFLTLIPVLYIRILACSIWMILNLLLFYFFIKNQWQNIMTGIQLLPAGIHHPDTKTEILSDEGPVDTKRNPDLPTEKASPALVERINMELQSIDLSVIKEDSDLTANLENMSSATAEISQGLNQTFELADRLVSTADEAFTKSQQLQTTVGTLDTRLNTINGLAAKLVHESGKIISIVNMLAEISSRTHVLSINASIVSARAGIHGRGFAVIAQEIRRLAEETETSLSTIEGIVDSFKNIITDVTAQNGLAVSDIEAQKDSLLAVAGALQGVQLSIEVIKTISENSKIKAIESEEQSKVIQQKFLSISNTCKKNSIKINSINSILSKSQN